MKTLLEGSGEKRKMVPRMSVKHVPSCIKNMWPVNTRRIECGAILCPAKEQCGFYNEIVDVEASYAPYVNGNSDFKVFNSEEDW